MQDGATGNPRAAVPPYRHTNNQDGMELNSIVDPLDNDEYLGLVGSGVRFGDVANQLDSPRIHNDLVGWRIDPAGLAPIELSWPVPCSWSNCGDGARRNDPKSPHQYV